ncbi:DNA cytosine methyltransferase [Qipengyuania flava]|uniref:DNA cytosine methyltransferase n=1 Tax=Qipengyuania flava TaxID=192812 RepID=UPI00141A8B4E|nr:DNA (cytosine-5-)-methyltransferase [Qipengyuania flava]NIJ61138.1 DNA (cytosine-5)-methyltransferase 1 [Qipengyuania flava]
MTLSALEICAGGGGQALGLEGAGYECSAVLEIDAYACQTLRDNRPNWNVLEADLKEFEAKSFRGIDLFAGGVPCPPFSVAGKQLGADDERDLFPTALRLISECEPAAVMLENVRGLASSRFDDYRKGIMTQLVKLGYEPSWQVLYAKDFGVPQLRPRFVLVAVKQKFAENFAFPLPLENECTVADALYDLVAAHGWEGAFAWRRKADKVAPTIVGGSKKHGGADLGPTRAKRQWAELGVDGKGIANTPPDSSMEKDHLIRLTIPMVARIQGFPDDWKFSGGKTAQYRQIGNAFPPPVAKAVGVSIQQALHGIPRNYQEGDQIDFPLAANG